MRSLSRKQTRMLIRILSAAALLAAAALVPDQFFPAEHWCVDLSGQWTPPADWLAAGYTLYSWPLLRPLLYLIPYGIIGWDVLLRSLRNIRNGQVFDENFLMTIATVGAFGTGEYAEAVFVMLFYQVGELFQDYAVGKSRQSIAALMDIRPDIANLELADGSWEEVDPEDVAVGAVVVVKPGERVPWTARCWRAFPLWTPPPSPANPFPGMWAPETR